MIINCPHRECVNGYVRGEYHEVCGGTGKLYVVSSRKPNLALCATLWATVIYAGVVTLAGIVTYFIVR